MDKFTNRELEIISSGLLCLIENAGKAKGLVMDATSQNDIDDYIRKLQELNLKVCRVNGKEMEASDKELRIEGIFYFSLLNGETEEQVKERFWKHTYEAGMIINDDCCSYSIQN